MSALEEVFGANGTLGRETLGEVVLVSRLRAALERLNPALPPEAIAAAIDELTRDRSAMLLEQANREVYRLLKEGIKESKHQNTDLEVLKAALRTQLKQLIRLKLAAKVHRPLATQARH